MTHKEMLPANNYQYAFDLLWDALREKNRQIERMYENILSKDILIHSLSMDIERLKGLLEPDVHIQLEEEGFFGAENVIEDDCVSVDIDPEEAEPCDWDWDAYYNENACK